MFKRDLFCGKHETFRARARRFIVERITPFPRAWEDAGEVPREPWRAP